ncbi:hypothetical protein EON83_08550 [bacterium]|nr:MAG: hypothetical protein EON83_08550 [bacterium]
MPNLTLQPWELPPDCKVPLTAAAEYVFRAPWQYGMAQKPRETEIWMRIVRYQNAFLHYFCDGERLRNGNWVLGSTTHFPYSSLSKFDEVAQQFRQNDNLWYESVSRLLYIEGTPYGSPGTYRITVMPSNGQCIIKFSTSTSEMKDDWRSTGIPSPFKSYSCPARATDTRTQLIAALKDSESKARSALVGIHLKPNKRREQIRKFREHKLKPMQALLRAALQAQVDVWQTEQPLFWQTSEPSPKELARINKYGWDGNALTLTTTHIALTIPLSLQRWKTAIWNTHITSAEDEWVLYQCLGCSEISSIDVTVQPPTAHERMEAIQTLRDWWQQTYTPLFFEGDSSSL